MLYYLTEFNFETIWDLKETIGSLTTNPLSANPQNGQTHSNKELSAFADELFECVWPFCGVGSYRVKKVILDTQADVFCTDVLCDRSEDWLWNFVGRL